jgi:hypothetical protein
VRGDVDFYDDGAAGEEAGSGRAAAGLLAELRA